MNATNKGIALHAGRVIRGTQDGFLYALDAKTGAMLWKRQVADWRIGEGIGAAPTVWNGLVYIAKAGGDWGIQGRLMAFKVEDGSPAWHFDLIPTGSQTGADTWNPPAPRSTAAAPRGPPTRSTARPARSICPSAIRVPTIRRRCARATTCSRSRSSHSTPKPARSSGPISCAPTTTTTGMPPPCRCSTAAAASCSRPRASRASCTSSIARPASACSSCP